jgi:hypothetical protein
VQLQDVGQIVSGRISSFGAANKLRQIQQSYTPMYIDYARELDINTEAE